MKDPIGMIQDLFQFKYRFNEFILTITKRENSGVNICLDEYITTNDSCYKA